MDELANLCVCREPLELHRCGSDFVRVCARPRTSPLPSISLPPSLTPLVLFEAALQALGVHRHSLQARRYEGLCSSWKWSKYVAQPGRDAFAAHVDGTHWPEPGLRLFYSLNVYLNAVDGRTRFYTVTNGGDIDFACLPEVGLALVFRQPPTARYLHDGEPVREGTKSEKYLCGGAMADARWRYILNDLYDRAVYFGSPTGGHRAAPPGAREKTRPDG